MPGPLFSPPALAPEPNKCSEVVLDPDDGCGTEKELICDAKRGVKNSENFMLGNVVDGMVLS